jgi:hypothetical protein
MSRTNPSSTSNTTRSMTHHINQILLDDLSTPEDNRHFLLERKESGASTKFKSNTYNDENLRHVLSYLSDDLIDSTGMSSNPFISGINDDDDEHLRDQIRGNTIQAAKL